MEIDLANGYVLRPWDAAWRDGDQGRFVTFANDYDIWINLRDRFPHPYTRADAEDWIKFQSGRDPTTVFAVCDAEGPIGAIGLETREADYRHSAEIGYWLGKPFWGRDHDHRRQSRNGLRLPDAGTHAHRRAVRAETTPRHACWRRRATNAKGCSARSR